MADAELWLETDYFERFLCKCGQCRNSCCAGWEIAVGMEDYFRLIGLDCAPETHHHLECAFRTPEAPAPERYRLISPNWLGDCPMHNGKGLCALQLECGAEALPEICRVYPRSLKEVAGEKRACCSGSCEAVIETLMRDAPLALRFGRLDAAPEYDQSVDAEALALGRACMEYLQDRSRPLAARLGKICDLIRGAELPIDPSRGAEGLCALVRAMEALRGDFRSLDTFGAAAMERYAPEDPAALERYRADAAALEARFPAWENWFENILANHLFYSCFPCVDARLKPADACAGLCAAYGMMRAACAARLEAHPNRADVADALAGVFRMIEHSAFYYNARVLLDAPEAILAL